MAWRETFDAVRQRKRWHAILAIVAAPFTGFWVMPGETSWRNFFIGLAIAAVLVVALLALLWFFG